MTPETPDPPPVSPDPWTTARARIYGLANRGLNICAEFTYRNEVPVSCERCGYEADVHLVRDLLAARAADALRHQQEISDIRSRHWQEKLGLEASITCRDETNERLHQKLEELRAALSAAEATLASLTAERDELNSKLDAWIAATCPGDHRWSYLDELRDEADTLRAELDRLHAALNTERLAGTAESWRLERADTVAALRSICDWIGDNDWPDDLHLADVIEKRLRRHLEAIL